MIQCAFDAIAAMVNVFFEIEIAAMVNIFLYEYKHIFQSARFKNMPFLQAAAQIQKAV